MCTKVVRLFVGIFRSGISPVLQMIFFLTLALASDYLVGNYVWDEAEVKYDYAEKFILVQNLSCLKTTRKY